MLENRICTCTQTHNAYGVERQYKLLVSVRHSVCAPCRLNALRDRRVLCGRPALPMIWTSALWLLEREKTVLKGAEQSTAEQGSAAVMEAITQSWGLPLSEEARGEVGGGNEEEEWEKGCLALPPGLHHRRDEDVGGEDSVVGAHEEEIQLDYRRIKCIFNHNAVFPDVTVKPLWETVRQLPSLSLSFLPLQLSGPATQYIADLAGVDMMAWTDVLQPPETKQNKKKIKSPHTHHATIFFMSKGLGIVDVAVLLCSLCKWDLCGTNVMELGIQQHRWFLDRE